MAAACIGGHAFYALSTYAESSILTRCSTHQELLVQLAKLDHAPALLKDYNSRLSTLKDCLSTHETELERIRSEGSSLDLSSAAKSAKDTLRRRNPFAAALKKKKKQKDKKSSKHGPSVAAEGTKDVRPEGRQETKDNVHASNSNPYGFASTSGTAEATEAVRKEMEEQMIVQLTQAEISNVHSQIAGIQPLAKEHGVIEGRLDALYENIFAGPTPEFPEEDEAELEVLALEKLQRENEASLQGAQDALPLIVKAASHSIYAYKALETVTQSTYQSTLAPRPTETVHKESILRSISHADSVSTFYKEARVLDFRTTDTVRLPPLSLLLRKYRDAEEQQAPASKETTKQWSAKVSSSVELLKEAARILHREQTLSQRRITAHTTVLRNTQNRLRVAREHLDPTRRTIFLDVVNDIRSRSSAAATIHSAAMTRQTSRASLNTVMTPDLLYSPSVGTPFASGTALSSVAATPTHHTTEELHGGSVREALLQVLTDETADALPDYVPRVKYYSDLPDNL